MLTIDLSCLGHVVQLGNVSFMGHITRVATIENANAIWEYDPTLPENRMLSGSLDVIVAVRTLAIKVRPPYLTSKSAIFVFHYRSRHPPSAWSTLSDYSMTLASRPH